MFKTKKRVISLILAAMMVLSMVSVFAFAEDTVAAFADSYATMYREMYGKEAVIENTAVLVDNSITAAEQAAESFTRTWDGIEFSFVYNVNAFTTLANAYASTNFVKDVIVLGIASSTTSDLSVSKASRVFSPAWDMVPMNEMRDDFDAIASDGADWTVNTAFTGKMIEVKNLYYTNALTSGSAEVYGFAVNNVIGWGGAYKAFRTANVNNPLTVKFVNGIYKSTNNALFYYKYSEANDNNDTVEIKNVYMNGAKNFDRNADNPHMPANVILDGFYYDMTNTTAHNFFQSKATNSSITIKNSYLTGTTTFRFCISHNNHYNLATAERVVTLHNNVLKHAASDGMLYMEPHNTSEIIITNNFIDKTADGGANLINSAVTLGSKLTGSQKKTITFTGNKIIGYKNAFNANLKNAFIINNNFVTSATGDAAKTAIGVSLSSPSGHTGDYYYDYAMKKWSGAVPLVDAENTTIGGVGATINNEDSTITIAGGNVEIAPSDFVNYTEYNNKIKEVTHTTTAEGEEVETGLTVENPSVTITDLSGATVSKIDTSVAGKYSVTVAYEGHVTKTYAVTVGDFSAPYFNDETNGYVGTTNGPDKNAVLLDTSLAGETEGSEVVKVWDDKPYTFIFGTNAFATYNEAETAATAEGASGKIIVTGWNGDAIAVGKSVNIYSPNWNTAPMDEMADANWKATASNDAGWHVNDDWKTGFVVNGVTVSTAVSKLGLYGLEYEDSITFADPSTGSNITSAEVVIKNSKFNKATNVLAGAFSVANTTKLDVVNMQVVDATNLIGANNVPAHTTFDGLYFSIAKLGRNNYFQVPNTVSKSSITIKNSYLFGTVSTYNIKMSHASSATLSSGTREFTFDNNVLIFRQSSGVLAFEPHDTTLLAITNNYINKTGDKAVLIDSGAAVGGRSGFVNAATRCSVEFTGNKIIGYQSGIGSAITNEFTPANNFVTTASGDAAKTAVGIALAAPKGGTGVYYYDFDMTKNSGALTMQTDGVFTVENDVVKVAKGAVVTADSIKANAMLDAPEGSAQPKVEIKNIDGDVVDSIDTSAATLYTITLSFDGVASNKYTLNVDNFVAHDFNADAENGGYVDETETITNTAILLDSSLEGEAIGSKVVRKWGDTYYTFIIGATAFADYAGAETEAAKDGGSKQIIVAKWNGDAIAVGKSVNIYSPNWNTVPMLEMADDFDALASNGADWHENDAWKSGFELASFST